ncbi:hypothetical protein [Peterkaempfera bronchialis]|uniref:hypothetical protein n=1 Tax=Peterkaempfera bronchialis TaxID=2126346 RepID=UPI003C2B4064
MQVDLFLAQGGVAQGGVAQGDAAQGDAMVPEKAVPGKRRGRPMSSGRRAGLHRRTPLRPSKESP